MNDEDKEERKKWTESETKGMDGCACVATDHCPEVQTQPPTGPLNPILNNQQGIPPEDSPIPTAPRHTTIHS
jgi:hypothetical protein